MDLVFSDEQLMLKQAVAEFVRREAPPDRVARVYQHEHGYDVRLFQRAAEAGWLGLLIPAGYGGQGGTLTDCVVAFEELGRAPAPGPFFSSGVLAAAIIQAAGSKEHMQRLLPRIARGDQIMTFAGMDSGLGWGPDLVETTLREDGDSLVLHGHKAFVHDAEAAGAFICLARSGDNLSLVLVDATAPGVSISRKEGLLSAVAEVRLEAVRVPRTALLCEPGEGWGILERALERALLVLCAFKVGACQQIFDMTVEYTRERVVFGQPIGRFQRVQDHVVDLADHLDAARWITYEALWRVESGDTGRAAIHEAKAVASEGYYQVVNFAHMVFAGPGTALDHPLMAHSTMSRTLYQYLGDPAYHKRRMMDEMFPPA